MAVGSQILGRRSRNNIPAPSCTDYDGSSGEQAATIDGYDFTFKFGQLTWEDDCDTISLTREDGSPGFTQAGAIEFDAFTLGVDKTISFDWEIVSAGTVAGLSAWYVLDQGVPTSTVTYHDGSVTGSASGTVSLPLLTGQDVQLRVGLNNPSTAEGNYVLKLNNFVLN